MYITFISLVRNVIVEIYAYTLHKKNSNSKIQFYKLTYKIIDRSNLRLSNFDIL